MLNIKLMYFVNANERRQSIADPAERERNRQQVETDRDRYIQSKEGKNGGRMEGREEGREGDR